MVKPNIMFLLDDSNSMSRPWLPDRASYWVANNWQTAAWEAFYPDPVKPVSHQYGRFSLQCNYLAYDPDVVYAPPLDTQGVQQARAPMTDFDDPRYKPFYYRYTPSADKAQPRMGFEYKPDGSVETGNSANLFFKQCNAPVGNANGKDAFTRVDVGVTSNEAQNFQNWRYYYSTRRDIARNAVKQVFNRLNDSYRIGFSVTSSDTGKDNSKLEDINKPTAYAWRFLNVADFTEPEKRRFFTAVDIAPASYNTPLRGALAKAGQYFSNLAKDQEVDPVQQSCQRNFTILATDGGWTKAGENSKFGPFWVDANKTYTDVGQQDKGEGVRRPMRDAGSDGVTTLADVAAYYYNTPLRSKSLKNCSGRDAEGAKVDLCPEPGNVPGEAADALKSYGDSATHQHMTLLAVGLGLNGELAYQPDYRTASSGDFYRLTFGTGADQKFWPAVKDPGPAADNVPQAHVDDLWHAAVNARGQYFSASDPVSLVRSLSGALDFVNASLGAAAAASTSTSRPVLGDNDAFIANYISQRWIGDVTKYTVDPETGKLLDADKWSARDKLDQRSADRPRTIYYAGKASQQLQPFDANNLQSDGYLADHFSNFCSRLGAGGSVRPDQCTLLSVQEFTEANKGENLVAYLRGRKSLPYYRTRDSLLGDITNASLVYVGLPGFPYPDSTYQDKFKESTKGRRKIVLAGANDGMLHAFDRKDGEELWAFVPTAVLPNMYKLADSNYANNHVSFVNATPVMADIKVKEEWKTIVVGGLGDGGRSYYALDITDTSNPKLLWEYKHPQLGQTYGNPIITQRKNGDWIVAFASGHNNNVTPAEGTDLTPGDGKGRLFMLNAYTGKPEADSPISTGVGTPESPAGLVAINAWVDSETQNTALRFYGGDLLGNLWRFDLDGTTEPKKAALKLATFVGPDDKVQPITTRPVVAEVKYKNVRHAMVYTATGRYLGTPDLTDKSVQSLYALKDPLVNQGWGDVRKGSYKDLVVEQTITAGGTLDAPTRAVIAKPVDLTTQAGWRVDFAVGGERVTVNPVMAVQTLYVGVNAPAPYTCQYGGTSYLYQFDIASGMGTASFQGTTLIQGLSVLQITAGADKGAVRPGITDSTGGFTVPPSPPPPFKPTLKRSSWRTLSK